MSDQELICLPMGICSWDYRVTGNQRGEARLALRGFSEQGEITIAGRRLTVRKQGWASGRWSLEHSGLSVAQACKPSIFSHRFAITADGNQFDLNRPSIFGSAYRLQQGNQPIAKIQRVHSFTRRATIQLTADPPLPVVLFAFWLVVMVWRRDQQAANSG